MGVATGCGFKEILGFPHTTYPYSSCICTFLQQHPYFFVHFVNVFTFFIITWRISCCHCKSLKRAQLSWQLVPILHHQRKKEENAILTQGG